MTTELCISDSDLARLREGLFPSEVEQCAIMYVAISKRSSGQIRLLVRSVEFADASEYSTQSWMNAELKPALVARVSKHARNRQLGLVFVHSHTDGHPPQFSIVDDRGERILAEFLARRNPHQIHASMVLSTVGMRARLLGEREEMRVVSIGESRTVEFDPTTSKLKSAEIFDRQVRAFGSEGQKQLQRLHIAIVGLGGTGSIVAQQLAHLGVREFSLVDHDLVEDVNLNRIVGAQRADIGDKKVNVAKKYIQSFDSSIVVNSIDGNVVYDSVATQLIDADIIFLCTDSHGSRAIVQQVAYQHMIPCIDMGSTITQQDGKITGIFGRVQMLSPGQPCLWCSHLLNSEEIRRDMSNEEERRLSPYIVGAREPAPSVISLNGTVVSLAVSMFLGIVTEVPIAGRHLIYNAKNSTLRAVRSKADRTCFICSHSNGVVGWGSGRELFTRKD